MPISTMLETWPAAVGQRRGAPRPFAEHVAGMHDLADDLARIEIAHEPLGARVAEAAGERAADLRGDAERAAVGLREYRRSRSPRRRPAAAAICAIRPTERRSSDTPGRAIEKRSASARPGRAGDRSVISSNSTARPAHRASDTPGPCGSRKAPLLPSACASSGSGQSDKRGLARSGAARLVDRLVGGGKAPERIAVGNHRAARRSRREGHRAAGLHRLHHGRVLLIDHPGGAVLDEEAEVLRLLLDADARPGPAVRLQRIADLDMDLAPQVRGPGNAPPGR